MLAFLKRLFTKPKPAPIKVPGWPHFYPPLSQEEMRAPYEHEPHYTAHGPVSVRGFR